MQTSKTKASMVGTVTRILQTDGESLELDPAARPSAHGPLTA